VALVAIRDQQRADLLLEEIAIVSGACPRRKVRKGKRYQQ
jgi:hypothetical protein